MGEQSVLLLSNVLSHICCLTLIFFVLILLVLTLPLLLVLSNIAAVPMRLKELDVVFVPGCPYERLSFAVSSADP